VGIVPIRKPRGRRLANRRRWALETLRLHVEDGGFCQFCASKYGAEHPWPCVPARIALLYIGEPQHGEQPARPGDLSGA
jgi:hypothetical protein